MDPPMTAGSRPTPLLTPREHESHALGEPGQVELGSGADSRLRRADGEEASSAYLSKAGGRESHSCSLGFHQNRGAGFLDRLAKLAASRRKVRALRTEA